MKHVLVHAYLQNNLGDDLFVRVLCNRYPHVTFHVYAHDSYKLRFQDIPNCQVHSPGDSDVDEVNNKKMRWLKIENGYFKNLIKTCDAVVHIGGSVFVQHHEDWSDFYKTDAELVKKSKKIFVVGANFGPYTNEQYYLDYKKLFKKYAGICFRDQYSKSLFLDMKNISYAPDVLWNLPVSPLPKKKKKVVFAPIELSHRTGKYDISKYEAEYMEYHLQLIRQMIRKGYKVSLLAFCPFQQDHVVTRKLYDALSEEEKAQVSCVRYDFDVFTLLREFEEAEAVVATRFHSAVIGMLCKCKVLPLIYDQKTRKMLEDMDYPWYMEFDEMKEIPAEECCKKLEELALYPVEDLVKESKGQFRYLDEFLNKSARS